MRRPLTIKDLIILQERGLKRRSQQWRSIYAMQQAYLNLHGFPLL